ncbi:MAG: ATP phosphoribosyltransferase regulatory subunit, partial [Roseibium sp.]|uniref:ATP phosphoribosyltransferase regulatory subunit n=1 Tax=Roseibium sp. TaxID=1936156 RepID=UPI0032968C1F
ETERLNAAIGRMAGSAAADDERRDVRLGFLSALEGTDPEAAHAVVEDLLSIAGISAVGGRTPSEIADRFLEQAALASGARGHDRAAETLTAYLSLQADGANAADALRDFAGTFNLGLDTPLAAFEQRLAAVEARGIAPSRLSFSADFGRRLDYYSGFVFEIHAANSSLEGPLVGGGRYDKLVTLLGAGEDVPAIGFSMWLDRIAASVAS